MKKTIFALLIVGICFDLSFVAAFFTFGLNPAFAASKDKPIELKFAHHNPPAGRTTVKFLNAWMKRVETATKGKVRIISYPAQSLAKSNEMVAAIEGGVADIGWIINGSHPGRFPLTEVISLPFLALSSAEKNGRIIQELYDKFPALQKEYASMKLLFIMVTDPFFIGMTKEPVRNLKDLRDKKIRVVGRIPVVTAKRLGIVPVGMPMPGLYEAARKGVVDGALLNWAMLPTFKVNEVFRYWTNADILPSIMCVVMNRDTWNGLPPDVQEGIMSVSGVDGAEFAGRSGWGPEIKEEVYATMRKTGKIMEEVTLDQGELMRWKKTVGQPIWSEWVKQIEERGFPGQSILDEAVRLAEKYK